MINIKRLSFDEARVLLDGCAKKSRDMGIPMCSAVTDESGHLVAFDRLDGGKISSISVAVDKAFTGAVARKGTHVYNELCQPGKPTFGIHITNEGHFSIIGGGLPVTVDGVIVGGVGVSSGTAGEDLVVAEAALAHFYTQTGFKP